MDRFSGHRPARTNHFDVHGIDGMGYRVGLSCYPPTPHQPYAGWTCISYAELEHLINTLISELQDLLRQADSYPYSNMLRHHDEYRPIPVDRLSTPTGLALRFFILKRDGYRCQICGRNAQDHGVVLEIDHRIPRAKGGTDDPANLWTLCFDCNRGKRDSDL